MGWQSEEFGASHEGSAGALLDDGTEPKPAVFDIGSGSSMHTTTEWWAYDGTFGHPRATHFRGACSCGWRGVRRYPIDWADLADVPHDADTSGPHEDWEEHLREVGARSVPLPADLEALLGRLDEQLSALTEDAPLAALKAVFALERTTGRVGRRAARYVECEDESWEAVGTALGRTAQEARSRVTRYSLGLGLD